jgi:hypothetical protein
MTDYIAIKLPVLHGTSTWDPEADGEGQRVCSLCGKGIQHFGGDPFGDSDSPVADRVVLSNTFGTVHVDCYPARLHAMEVRDAWVTIATDMARRPSAFTAAEIRAALTALARLAGGAA